MCEKSLLENEHFFINNSPTKMRLSKLRLYFCAALLFFLITPLSNANPPDSGLVFTVMPNDSVQRFDSAGFSDSDRYVVVQKMTTCIKSGANQIPFRLTGYGTLAGASLQLTADGLDQSIEYQVKLINRDRPEIPMDLFDKRAPTSLPSPLAACTLSDQYVLEVTVSETDLANAQADVYMDFFTLQITPE